MTAALVLAACGGAEEEAQPCMKQAVRHLVS